VQRPVADPHDGGRAGDLLRVDPHAEADAQHGDGEWHAEQQHRGGAPREACAGEDHRVRRSEQDRRGEQVAGERQQRHRRDDGAELGERVDPVQPEARRCGNVGVGG